MAKLVVYRENPRHRRSLTDVLFSPAPIPGGCNMEFDIEIAPYQKLNIGNGIIIVDTQPSSAPATNNSHPYLCEKSLVQHKMYRLYLPRQDFTPETYFDAIASMLLARDIVQTADEVFHEISLERRITFFLNALIIILVRYKTDTIIARVIITYNLKIVCGNEEYLLIENISW